MASPNARETMLTRVRDALGRSHTLKPQVTPTVDDKVARLASKDDDLLARFTTGAEAVGMVVQRVTQADLPQRIVERLGEWQAESVVIAMREPDVVAGEVEGAGVTVVDWRQSDGMDVQYDVDAGITDVDAALAETGTLIGVSDAHHSRGPSLVPPHHLAIVRRSDILPDLLDYLAARADAAPRDLPSSTVLITGPSKTADIEGELITGVHGPKDVHILLVEDA